MKHRITTSIIAGICTFGMVACFGVTPAMADPVDAQSQQPQVQAQAGQQHTRSQSTQQTAGAQGSDVGPQSLVADRLKPQQPSQSSSQQNSKPNTQDDPSNQAKSQTEQLQQSDVAAGQPSTSTFGNGIEPRGVHDEMTGDDGVVSNISQSEVVDGTQPWVSPDGPGNDANDHNGIVRSFDSVTYDVQYSLQPNGGTDYYKSAEVSFKIVLPLPADQAVINTDAMQWADTENGHSIQATRQSIGGIDSEVVTLDVHAVGDSSNPYVAPGSKHIYVPISVRMAPNNTQIQPQVTAWLTDGAHNEQSTTLTPIRVSAAPKFNVHLTAFNARGYGSYDFGADPSAPNSSAGVVKGNLVYFWVQLSMTNDGGFDQSIKGIEAPQGRISFDVNLTDTHTDAQTGNDLGWLRNWAPKLWGWDLYQEPHFSTRPVYAIPSDAASVGTPDTGDWNISQSMTSNGSVLHFTVDNYHIRTDPATFPQTSLDGCYPPRYYDQGSKAYSQDVFSSQSVALVVPETQNNQTAYNQFNSPSGHDIRVAIDLHDVDLRASTVSGQSLSQVNDNTNQRLTNDDYANQGSELHIPGSYTQDVAWSCPSTPYQDQGMDCKDWRYDWSSDTDQAMPDSDVKVSAGPVVNGDASTLPVSQINYAFFDGDKLSVKDDQPAYQPVLNAHAWGPVDDEVVDSQYYKTYWCVKHDGSNWRNLTEQKNATDADVDVYPTISQARSHGTIVGVAYTIRLAYPSKYANIMNKMHAGATLHVNSSTPVGSLINLTGFARMYSRGEMSARTGLDPYTSSDADWQNAADALPDIFALHNDASLQSVTADSTGYFPPTYDSDGQLVTHGSADTLKGDALYIRGEEAHVSIASDKDTYNFDASERTAQWTISTRVNSHAPVGSTTQGTYTVTLDKGLHFRAHSLKYGNTVIEPTVTTNGNGQTVLTFNYTLPLNTDYRFTFATDIGTPENPITDSRNADSYQAVVTMYSTHDHRTIYEQSDLRGAKNISVARTRSSNIGIVSKPKVVDPGDAITFNSTVSNNSTTANSNPRGDVTMPGSPLSDYHGSYTATGASVQAVDGASLTGIVIWGTTSASVRGSDPMHVADPPAVGDGWHQLAFTVSGDTATISVPSGLTGIAFKSPSLNPGASFKLAVTIHPSGDTAGDVFTARLADGNVFAQDSSNVADRTVEGTVWYDANHNGFIDGNEASAEGLSGIPVCLAAPGSNTCSSAVQMTDNGGTYKFEHVNPLGGTVVRFAFTSGSFNPSSYGNVKTTVGAPGSAPVNTASLTPANAGIDGAATSSSFDLPRASLMSDALLEIKGQNMGLYGARDANPVGLNINKTYHNLVYLQSAKNVDPTSTFSATGLTNITRRDDGTSAFAVPQVSQPGTRSWTVAETGTASPLVMQTNAHTYKVTDVAARTPGTLELTHRVTVTYVDGSSCGSDCSVSGNTALVKFFNRFNPSGSWQLNLKKEMTGRDAAANEFSFWLHDGHNAQLVTHSNPAIAKGSSVNIGFASNEVAGSDWSVDGLDAMVGRGLATRATDVSGHYVWTIPMSISENPFGSFGLSHTLQNTDAMLKLTLGDNGAFTYTSPNGDADIVNTYDTQPQEVSLTSHEQLDTSTPQMSTPDITHDYTVTITGTPGEPMPSGCAPGSTSCSQTNPNGGSMNSHHDRDGGGDDFGHFSFSYDDIPSGQNSTTFTYQVCSARTGGSAVLQNQTTPDPHSCRQINVTLTNNNGEIDVDVSDPDSGSGSQIGCASGSSCPVPGSHTPGQHPSFGIHEPYINTFSGVPVTSVVGFTKTLKGRNEHQNEHFDIGIHSDQTGTDYPFQVTGLRSGRESQVYSQTASSCSMGPGQDFCYDRAGSHRYTVKEAAGFDPQIVYDNHTFTAVDTITDDGVGQLHLAQAFSRDDGVSLPLPGADSGTKIHFENVYRPFTLTLPKSGDEWLTLALEVTAGLLLAGALWRWLRRRGMGTLTAGLH